MLCPTVMGTRSAQPHPPLLPPPREQRVTGIIVFVLTGISVFLAPILKVKHPPLPHPCSAGGWGGFFPPPPIRPPAFVPLPSSELPPSLG